MQTDKKKKNLGYGKSGNIFYQKRYKGKRYYLSLQTKDWNEAKKLRDQYNYELIKYGYIANEVEEANIVPVFGAVCLQWYEDKKVDPNVRTDTLDNYKKTLNGQIVKTPF